MRSTGMKRHGLMAALAIAAMGAGAEALVQAAPLRSAGSSNNRRPTPPRRNTALAREIADHNAEVGRRKAEKRDKRRNAAIDAAMKEKP